MKKLNEKKQIVVLILLELALLLFVNIRIGLNLEFLFNVFCGVLGLTLLEDYKKNCSLRGSKK